MFSVDSSGLVEDDSYVIAFSLLSAPEFQWSEDSEKCYQSWFITKFKCTFLPWLHAGFLLSMPQSKTTLFWRRNRFEGQFFGSLNENCDVPIFQYVQMLWTFNRDKPIFSITISVITFVKVWIDNPLVSENVLEKNPFLLKLDFWSFEKAIKLPLILKFFLHSISKVSTITDESFCFKVSIRTCLFLVDYSIQEVFECVPCVQIQKVLRILRNPCFQTHFFSITAGLVYSNNVSIKKFFLLEEFWFKKQSFFPVVRFGRQKMSELFLVSTHPVFWNHLSPKVPNWLHFLRSQSKTCYFCRFFPKKLINLIHAVDFW